MKPLNNQPKTPNPNDDDDPIIILKKVDVECVLCGWRSIEELPFVVDGGVHWLTCPDCAGSTRLDLAIIQYLDESE